jgi:hypothetical protein
LTSHTEDTLAKLSPESATDLQECLIEDAATGRTCFAAKGLAAFRYQFARVGIDIRRIRKREELRAACVRSEHVFVDDLQQMVRGHTELEEALNSVWPPT